LFSTATRCSKILSPVTPRKVLVARLNPVWMASSKLLGEAEISSVTLAIRLVMISPPFCPQVLAPAHGGRRVNPPSWKRLQDINRVAQGAADDKDRLNFSYPILKSNIGKFLLARERWWSTILGPWLLPPAQYIFYIEIIPMVAWWDLWNGTYLNCLKKKLIAW